MKVVKSAKYSIYIYSEEHLPPHCHVRYKDGSEVCVDIPLIIPRFGVTISKELANLIIKNIDKLCEKWDELNPSKEFNSH